MIDQDALDAAAFDRGFMAEHRRVSEVEPGVASYLLTICALCGQPLADDNCPDECATAAAEVDWPAYRKCPTCLAATGCPCVALNGRVAGGRPDGKRTALPVAHAHRRRRAGR